MITSTMAENEQNQITREQIIESLKTVMDPEVFLDVWFLGLIYNIAIGEEGQVDIDMTFTTPLCPAGPQLVDEVKAKICALGAKQVNVQVVFTPPWQPSDEVKAMLGMI